MLSSPHVLQRHEPEVERSVRSIVVNSIWSTDYRCVCGGGAKGVLKKHETKIFTAK